MNGKAPNGSDTSELQAGPPGAGNSAAEGDIALEPANETTAAPYMPPAADAETDGAAIEEGTAAANGTAIGVQQGDEVLQEQQQHDEVQAATSV